MTSIGTRTVHASDSRSPGDNQIPIEGSYSGTVRFSDDPNIVIFDGTGSATHLGPGTNQGRAVISGVDDTKCSGGLANVNYETLVGANGDSLTIASNDVGCPTGPGQYHGTGEWTVTGGTGRFSGATGHGTLDGHSDLVQNVFSFTLTGTISAPNGQ